jgi:hypothetical protein
MVLQNLLSLFLLTAVPLYETPDGFVVQPFDLQFIPVNHQVFHILALGTTDFTHQAIGHANVIVIIELNHHVFSSQVSSLS